VRHLRHRTSGSALAQQQARKSRSKPQNGRRHEHSHLPCQNRLRTIPGVRSRARPSCLVPVRHASMGSCFESGSPARSSVRSEVKMADRKSFLLLLRAAAVALAVIAAGPTPALLAEEVKPAQSSTRLPPDVVTEHVIELPGRTLRFKATAGSIPITSSKGKVLAEMGYIAYALDGVPARQ